MEIRVEGGGAVRFTTEIVRQIIREEVVAATDSKTRLSKSSIDDQIDSLFIKFEKESLKTESQIRSLMKLMFEAPEDEEEFVPAEDEAENEEPSSVGSDERDEEWSAEPNKPPIDMNQFVRRVVRLIENYDALLDVRTVIVQRAKNYVLENYDEAAAQDFKEFLEEDHGISLHPKDNLTDTPAAMGAGPGVA